jgi:hypothetical protein
MSSLMIIQEHDRLTFAVDTANCVGLRNGEKYRVRDKKILKIHKAGTDMVFIAGLTECTTQVRDNLNKFIRNKHINSELLMQYLKKNYPKEKCKWTDIGIHDIGVTVLSVINGTSTVTSFSQLNDYKPDIKKGIKGSVALWADGFDCNRLYKKALKYIKEHNNNYLNPEMFITVYQNNYSEAVGGYIKVYSMDSNGCALLKESQLEERNLKYAYYE